MNFMIYVLFFLVSLPLANIQAMSHSKPRLGISVAELKGTHNFLEEKYQDYAPFWGLVFIDKNVARQLYVFSGFYNKQKADIILKKTVDPALQSFKEEIEQYFKQDHNTKTQNLVRCLFHEVAETFTITNAPNNPIRQLTPKHIGTILRMVYDAGKDYSKLRTTLKAYLLSLNFKDPNGKPFIGKDFNPFINSLSGSLSECDDANKQAIFAQNTTQGIMLGYLLLKSNDRADLEQYFSGFLGTPVTLSDEKYTKTEIGRIMNNRFDINNVQELGNFVCAKLYQEKYTSIFPKIIDHTSVDFNGFSFTDCTESVIRNMANIATYNQSILCLGKAPNNLIMSDALQQFYAAPTHEDPLLVNHKNIHQAWANIVENIPGASYNKLGNKTTQKATIAVACDGFIPVATVDKTLPTQIIEIGTNKYLLYKKTVGNYNYLLVPAELNLICFELMSSPSNVIVLMNHLFNLELYPNIDTVLQASFVTNHFASMCTKFGWNINQLTLDGLKDDQNSKNFSIRVTVTADKTFTIHLIHKNHASLDASKTIMQQLATPLNSIESAPSKIQAIAAALKIGILQLNTKIIYFENIINLNTRYSIQTFISNDDHLKVIFNNLTISFGYEQNDHLQIRLLNTPSPIRNNKNSYPYKIEGMLYCIDNISTGSYPMQVLVENDFLDSKYTKPIIFIIEQTFQKDSLSPAAFNLMCAAIKKQIFNRSDAEQIIFWIKNALQGSDTIGYYSVIKSAHEATIHGLLTPSDLGPIINLIKKAALYITDEKLTEWANALTIPPKLQPLLTPTKTKLTLAQLKNMQAGLPKDMQPLTEEQLRIASQYLEYERRLAAQQFYRPTAEQLAAQREQMDQFNREWNATYEQEFSRPNIHPEDFPLPKQTQTVSANQTWRQHMTNMMPKQLPRIR